MDIQSRLEDFAGRISKGEIEIYNEYSVQFELAIFLRTELSNRYKIQLERNISYFGLNKQDFLKKEMDIVIFDSQTENKHCIEIKFPTNGQYPEQMFSVCKDIKFLEELVHFGFSESYLLVIVNDPLFYVDKGETGIYRLFRKDKILKGSIQKPTGKKDTIYHLANEYKLNWRSIDEIKKYLILKVSV